jgi:hypothetical protein
MMIDGKNQVCRFRDIRNGNINTDTTPSHLGLPERVHVPADGRLQESMIFRTYESYHGEKKFVTGFTHTDEPVFELNARGFESIKYKSDPFLRPEGPDQHVVTIDRIKDDYRYALNEKPVQLTNPAFQDICGWCDGRYFGNQLNADECPQCRCKTYDIKPAEAPLNRKTVGCICGWSGYEKKQSLYHEPTKFLHEICD